MRVELLPPFWGASENTQQTPPWNPCENAQMDASGPIPHEGITGLTKHGYSYGIVLKKRYSIMDISS